MLLDGVSTALRNAEEVHLEKKPRMADFAVRATAMEACFGWEADSFVEVYAANRQQASETLLANEPVADAIEKLLGGDRGSPWSGTATELQKALGRYADDEIKRSKAWPKGPQALSRRLNRIAPALRSAGIGYTEHEQGHRKKKVKNLRKLVGDDEEAQVTDEEAREDEADREDEATAVEEEHENQSDSDGEERRVGNPFKFTFDDPSEPEDTEVE